MSRPLLGMTRPAALAAMMAMAACAQGNFMTVTPVAATLVTDTDNTTATILSLKAPVIMRLPFILQVAYIDTVTTIGGDEKQITEAARTFTLTKSQPKTSPVTTRSAR